MDPPESDDKAELQHYGFPADQIQKCLVLSNFSKMEAFYLLCHQQFQYPPFNPSDFPKEVEDMREDENTMLLQILEDRFIQKNSSFSIIIFPPQEYQLEIHLPKSSSYPFSLPFIVFRSTKLSQELVLEINKKISTELLTHSLGEALIYSILTWFEESVIPFIEKQQQAPTPKKINSKPAESDQRKSPEPSNIETQPNPVLFTEAERKEYIKEFIQNGFVCLPVFSEEEVQELRNQFHASLGIDHEKALIGDSETLKTLGGPRGKSIASSFYYEKWKFNAWTHPKIVDFMTHLMNATFGPGNVPGFEHPLGSSSSLLFYFDGCQYRLPDHIQAEGGLGLHLDRNPIDPYLLNPCVTKKLQKFRPIQSWIGLTDQYGCDCGGLRLVRGFHKEIDKYFSAQPHTEQQEFSRGGEFFRLNSKSHALLWNRLEPVNAPAGSLVLWDNRLAHATSECLIGCDTREVLFGAFLPAVPLNIEYAKLQMSAIKKKTPPPAYEDSKRPFMPQRLTWTLEELAVHQRKLLGLPK